MSTSSHGLRISDHDQAMFDALRKFHLRHPGMLAKKVVKLLYLDRVTTHQIATALTEYLRLGLSPVHNPTI